MKFSNDLPKDIRTKLEKLFEGKLNLKDYFQNLQDLMLEPPNKLRMDALLDSAKNTY